MGEVKRGQEVRGRVREERGDGGGAELVARERYLNEQVSGGCGSFRQAARCKRVVLSVVLAH